MSDIEAKQQFLRSEIIDQGYDPNAFSDFMGTLRGDDGLNLDNWSFNDLQEAVKQFILQQNPNQNQNQNIQEPQQPNQTQNNNHDQPEPTPTEVKQEPIQKKNSNQPIPNEPFENYEVSIKTEKLENNEITEVNNLSITISNPTQIKGGLLSPSYYQYTMKTIPIGYEVVRKLSDFTFLYETLPLINTAVYNPLLPHFEFNLKDDSPKKMLYLQNYMNSLIENKFFRSLPIVYQFITVPQDKWNVLRQNNYSKLKPSPLSKMPTLEGEFHININKDLDSKAVKIKEEINKKGLAFENLNTAMDELLATLEKLSNCYKSVANSFFNLSKCYQNNEALHTIFTKLTSLANLGSKDYIRERDFLKDDIKYFFKFIHKESTSYLKKFDEFKSARDSYTSKFEKVKKMPNKPQKDIDLVKKLRFEYGLLLLTVNREYEELLGRQANRCIIQFNKFDEHKDALLQNFNICLKLLTLNEEQNEENNQQNQEQGTEQYQQ